MLFAALSFAINTAATAQECTPYQLQIQSYPFEGGPETIILSIQDPNGFWLVEGLSVDVSTGNFYWQETFCLWTGCYTVYMTPDVPVSPENLSINVLSNGQEVPFDLNYGDATVFAEICVEDAVTDCPEAIEYIASEGCTGIFEIASFVEGENVVWQFNDGSEPETGGHFITHEFPGAGVYVVNAFYASNDCPNGVELTGTVVIEGCGPMEDCTLELESYTMDGMWYEFQAVGMPEDATYQWYYNDLLVEGATGSTFEGGGDFNPYWWVCVEAVSANCPDGQEACFYNMGGSGCPDSLAVTQMENPCAFLFSFENDGAPAVEIQWYVDGGLIETTSGLAFDYAFDAGVHTVQAMYQSLSCTEAWYDAVVEVPESCGSSDACQIQLEHFSPECNQFVVEAFNYPENATLWWTLDGEPFDNGTNIVELSINDMECHVIAVGFETPDCPQWVMAEVQLCPEECGGSCDVEIIADELADGIYLFTAIDNATGLPLEGEPMWMFGGGMPGSPIGNPVTWTWGEGAPDLASVCVYCSDVPEDVACMDFQPAAMGCEEVSLVLTADMVEQVGMALEFYVTAELMGYDLNPLMIVDALTLLDGAAGDTLTFCLPPACFELIMQPPNVPIDNFEGVLLEALNGNGEAIASLDLLATTWGAFAFGLAEGCLNAVAEVPGVSLQAFPNPVSTGSFTLQGLGDEPLDITVRDAAGRVVFQSNNHPVSAPIRVEGWPSGPYILQASGNDFVNAVVRLIVMQ